MCIHKSQFIEKLGGLRVQILLKVKKYLSFEII